MSLIECHECKKQISDEAAACPNCGAKVRKAPAPKKPMSRAAKLLILMAAVAFIGTMLLQETAPEYVAAEKENIARIGYIQSAKSDLLKAARDPESLVVERALTNKDGSVVCLEYRARNGFGGMNKEFVAFAAGKANSKPEHWNRYCTQGMIDMTWAAK